MQSINDRDLELMVRTAWGQARQDGAKAMQGIAEVILNRLKDDRWPSSVEALCTDGSWFPFWRVGAPGHGEMRLASLNDYDYRLAYRATLDALEGSDITNGANDFEVARQRLTKSRQARPTAEIGRYRFLKHP